MLEGIDHIAIAVESLSASIPLWRDQFQFEYHGTEEVASEGVRVALLVKGPFRVELMEPMGSDSPVYKFLQKRGPGLHHLCLKVEGLDGHMAALKEAGLSMIHDTPRPGAEGRRVAFIHPKSAGGVLVELSEGGHGE
ncbi:MAG TPA: methylmalonyl-CoA epimerase [Planctomycetota bacterium]|mgnify:CR=1 FL=1|jgi:methylmalonyl-CoA/ethylmalonyl-CoA epimerase|nr:methylmalonyl-CoA epimerase [Planctomycetota bacterium]